MAKYTSDTNLIRGAAAAYKDYDNVAGMYSGLDKVTKFGTDLMEKNIKQRKEVEKNLHNLPQNYTRKLSYPSSLQMAKPSCQIASLTKLNLNSVGKNIRWHR